MAKRWGNRPPGSNWGEFGDDDQHERMNYITAERKPPLFHPVYRGDRVYFNFASSEIDPHFNDVGSDEANMLYMQYSTHRDSFEHKGTVFDADGDGVEEKASHNGCRRVDDEEKGLNNALGALRVCWNGSPTAASSQLRRTTSRSSARRPWAPTRACRIAARRCRCTSIAW